MTEIRQIRKQSWSAWIRRNRGILRTMAREMGVSHSTLSRTISGDIKTPNPRIVAALLNARRGAHAQ